MVRRDKGFRRHHERFLWTPLASARVWVELRMRRFTLASPLPLMPTVVEPDVINPLLIC